MNPHPLPPDSLRRYATSDWRIDCSCLPSPLNIPVPPLRTPVTLRDFLFAIWSDPLIPEEYRVDLEIFGEKFKRFLRDGVPVKCVQPLTEKSNNLSHTEAKVMYLSVVHSETRICFTKPEDWISMNGNGRGNVFNRNLSDEIIFLGDVVRVSRIPPKNMIIRSKDQNKFVLLQSDLDNYEGHAMIIAKNEKDASLLNCGFKLLLDSFEKKGKF